MDLDQSVAASKTMGLTSIAEDLDFRGQTVLVTGGADGIGAAKVRALHHLGAHVIALDVQAVKLEELQSELGDECLTILTFDLNQSDPAAYRELGSKILAASPSGKIDGYIMNAGVVKLTDIKKFNTVANTPMTEFYGLAQINAHSHVAIYQEIRDHFAPDARIVVTSSPIVGRADPRTAAYSVTKRMMDSYANNIAAELKGTDIRISGYVPPPVQNFLRTDLKPKEPLYAHPQGIDIVELPLRLAARSLKPEFNGKVIAYGYDHLRDKSAKLPDGTAYDFMPRSTADNGFVYDLRIRRFDDGGGDGGEPFIDGYSTAVIREILGKGRTPDMQIDKSLNAVYTTPDHVSKFRKHQP